METDFFWSPSDTPALSNGNYNFLVTHKGMGGKACNDNKNKGLQKKKKKVGKKKEKKK
jgi:hypothetical protein